MGVVMVHLSVHIVGSLVIGNVGVCVCVCCALEFQAGVG